MHFCRSKEVDHPREMRADDLNSRSRIHIRQHIGSHLGSALSALEGRRHNHLWAGSPAHGPEGRESRSGLGAGSIEVGGYIFAGSCDSGRRGLWIPDCGPTLARTAQCLGIRLAARVAAPRSAQRRRTSKQSKGS